MAHRGPQPEAGPNACRWKEPRPRAKYHIHAGYTAEGAKGLLKEGGTGRRRAMDDVVAGLGGTIEAVYFAFGEDDLVSIIDFPTPPPWPR